jgi:hypothetical protein
MLGIPDISFAENIVPDIELAIENNCAVEPSNERVPEFCGYVLNVIFCGAVVAFAPENTILGTSEELPILGVITRFWSVNAINNP